MFFDSIDVCVCMRMCVCMCLCVRVLKCLLTCSSLAQVAFVLAKSGRSWSCRSSSCHPSFITTTCIVSFPLYPHGHGPRMMLHGAHVS